MTYLKTNILSISLWMEICSTTLVLREEYRYDLVWTDEGSGSTIDGAFWKPKLNTDEAFLSFVNTIGYSEPTSVTSVLITSWTDGALKDPVDYTWIWDGSGSDGAYDIYWYRPIPPSGYVCFGDVIRTSVDAFHDHEGYKCVHQDHVNELNSTRIIQQIMWTDRGSGADDDGSVFKITLTTEQDRLYPYTYYLMQGNYELSISGPFYSFATNATTKASTIIPMEVPTNAPTHVQYPVIHSTSYVSDDPTSIPTSVPTEDTEKGSAIPTQIPTTVPTQYPTINPTATSIHETLVLELPTDHPTSFLDTNGDSYDTIATQTVSKLQYSNSVLIKMLVIVIVVLFFAFLLSCGLLVYFKRNASNAVLQEIRKSNETLELQMQESPVDNIVENDNAEGIGMNNKPTMQMMPDEFEVIGDDERTTIGFGNDMNK